MKSQLQNKGFVIKESIYTDAEIDEMLSQLSEKQFAGRFGVREFLVKCPEIQTQIFNKKLQALIKEIAPDCTKSIKSIYFDKPPSSNWIVNWHQDLTINLTNRTEVDNYKNWRKTKERIIVQPNRELLESIFTIRIHLDDCSAQNGALRVIEASHLNGTINITKWLKKKSGKKVICEVNKGGVLIMKPLILHASKRTENQMNRRVIHIEFTDKEIPQALNWKEKIEFETR